MISFALAYLCEVATELPSLICAQLCTLCEGCFRGLWVYKLPDKCHYKWHNQVASNEIGKLERWQNPQQAKVVCKERGNRVAEKDNVLQII